MQSKAPTIEAYLAGLPVAQRDVIATLDQLVRSTAPHARATMKFGMPTYEIGDRLLALNAQKQYFSLYADPELSQPYRPGLAHLDCGKSCIRFKRLADLPLDTVRAIVRAYGPATAPA